MSDQYPLGQPYIFETGLTKGISPDVLFLPDRHLALADTRNVKVWKWSYISDKKSFSLDERQIYEVDTALPAIGCHHAKKLLVTYSAGCLVLRSYTDSNKCIMIPLNIEKVIALAVAPKTNLIACVGLDSPIVVVSSKDRKVVKSFNIPNTYSVCFDRSGKRLIVGGKDCCIRIMNMDTETCDLELPIKLTNQRDSWINCLGFMEQYGFLGLRKRDELVVVGMSDGRLAAVSLFTDRLPRSICNHDGMQILSLNVYLNTVLSVGADGTIRLGIVSEASNKHYNFEDNDRGAVLAHLPTSIGSIDSTLRGLILSVGSQDGNGRIWNVTR